MTSFELPSFRSSPSMRQIFSNRDDATPQAVDAWKRLLTGLERQDAATISGAFAGARGSLSLWTQHGNPRPQSIVRRTHALLNHNPYAEDAAQRGMRSFHTGETEKNQLHYVSAHQLLVWIAPALLPEVLRAQVGTFRYSTPADQWIRNDGDLFSPLKDGGVRGDGVWNEHWPATVATLAMLAMDDDGAQWVSRLKDFDPRKFLYIEDTTRRRWLNNVLNDPLTREDLAFNNTRLTTLPSTNLCAEIHHVETTWQAALTLAERRGMEAGWGTDQWSEWARRWMLSANGTHVRDAIHGIARVFWTHCPDAILPLRRSDPISPSRLMDASQAVVFTDERLARWINEGEGINLCPARVNPQAQWHMVNPQHHRLNMHQESPWTLFEWAVSQQRLGVVQRLVNAGHRPIEGFAQLWAPHTFQQSGGTHVKGEAWAKIRDQRRKALEPLELLISAHEATPAPSVPRPRTRL